MDKFKVPSHDHSDDYNDFLNSVTTGVMDEKGNIVRQMSRNPERRPGRRFFHVFRKVVIQLGLVLLLAGYLVGGGYLFRTLELENEYSECKQKFDGYSKRLNFSVQRVIGLVQSNADKTDGLVRDLLEEFAYELFKLDFQPTTDCEQIMSSDDSSAKWSLANSIFFCATVITTIGYGNIAPLTFWGRIICVFYATIGIPLMLIYLAILGNLMARAFRLIYVNLVCCRCFYDVFRRKRQKRRARLRMWEQALKEHEEEEAKRHGLPVPPPKVQDLYFEDEPDLEAENHRNGEATAVPLTVSVFVLSSYTAIGALIFQIWEGWSFADAAYFSFITISTIGFGDFVPGASVLHETERWAELTIGAIYLLFGLALLSMCLNLLKDEMIAKIKYLTHCCSGRKDSTLQAETLNETEKVSKGEILDQKAELNTEATEGFEEVEQVEFVNTAYEHD